MTEYLENAQPFRFPPSSSATTIKPPPRDGISDNHGELQLPGSSATLKAYNDDADRFCSSPAASQNLGVVLSPDEDPIASSSQRVYTAKMAFGLSDGSASSDTDASFSHTNASDTDAGPSSPLTPGSTMMSSRSSSSTTPWTPKELQLVGRQRQASFADDGTSTATRSARENHLIALTNPVSTTAGERTGMGIALPKAPNSGVDLGGRLARAPSPQPPKKKGLKTLALASGLGRSVFDRSTPRSLSPNLALDSSSRPSSPNTASPTGTAKNFHESAQSAPGSFKAAGPKAGRRSPLPLLKSPAFTTIAGWTSPRSNSAAPDSQTPQSIVRTDHPPSPEAPKKSPKQSAFSPLRGLAKGMASAAGTGRRRAASIGQNRSVSPRRTPRKDVAPELNGSGTATQNETSSRSRARSFSRKKAPPTPLILLAKADSPRHSVTPLSQDVAAKSAVEATSSATGTAADLPTVDETKAGLHPVDAGVKPSLLSPAESEYFEVEASPAQSRPTSLKGLGLIFGGEEPEAVASPSSSATTPTAQMAAGAIERAPTPPKTAYFETAAEAESQSSSPSDYGDENDISFQPHRHSTNSVADMGRSESMADLVRPISRPPAHEKEPVPLIFRRMMRESTPQLGDGEYFSLTASSSIDSELGLSTIASAPSAAEDSATLQTSFEHASPDSDNAEQPDEAIGIAAKPESELDSSPRSLSVRDQSARSSQSRLSSLPNHSDGIHEAFEYDLIEPTEDSIGADAGGADIDDMLGGVTPRPTQHMQFTGGAEETKTPVLEPDLLVPQIPQSNSGSSVTSSEEHFDAGFDRDAVGSSNFTFATPPARSGPFGALDGDSAESSSALAEQNDGTLQTEMQKPSASQTDVMQETAESAAGLSTVQEELAQIPPSTVCESPVKVIDEPALNQMPEVDSEEIRFESLASPDLAPDIPTLRISQESGKVPAFDTQIFNKPLTPPATAHVLSPLETALTDAHQPAEAIPQNAGAQNWRPSSRLFMRALPQRSATSPMPPQVLRKAPSAGVLRDVKPALTLDTAPAQHSSAAIGLTPRPPVMVRRNTQATSQGPPPRTSFLLMGSITREVLQDFGTSPFPRSAPLPQGAFAPPVPSSPFQGPQAAFAGPGLGGRPVGASGGLSSRWSSGSESEGEDQRRTSRSLGRKSTSARKRAPSTTSSARNSMSTQYNVPAVPAVPAIPPLANLPRKGLWQSLGLRKKSLSNLNAQQNRSASPMTMTFDSPALPRLNQGEGNEFPFPKGPPAAAAAALSNSRQNPSAGMPTPRLSHKGSSISLRDAKIEPSVEISDASALPLASPKTQAFNLPSMGRKLSKSFTSSQDRVGLGDMQVPVKYAPEFENLQGLGIKEAEETDDVPASQSRRSVHESAPDSQNAPGDDATSKRKTESRRSNPPEHLTSQKTDKEAMLANSDAQLAQIASSDPGKTASPERVLEGQPSDLPSSSTTDALAYIGRNLINSHLYSPEAPAHRSLGPRQASIAAVATFFPLEAEEDQTTQPARTSRREAKRKKAERLARTQNGLPHYPSLSAEGLQWQADHPDSPIVSVDGPQLLQAAYREGYGRGPAFTGSANNSHRQGNRGSGMDRGEDDDDAPANRRGFGGDKGDQPGDNGRGKDDRVNKDLNAAESDEGDSSSTDDYGEDENSVSRVPAEERDASDSDDDVPLGRQVEDVEKLQQRLRASKSLRLPDKATPRGPLNPEVLRERLAGIQLRQEIKLGRSSTTRNSHTLSRDLAGRQMSPRAKDDPTTGLPLPAHSPVSSQEQSDKVLRARSLANKIRPKVSSPSLPGSDSGWPGATRPRRGSDAASKPAGQWVTPSTELMPSIEQTRAAIAASQEKQAPRSAATDSSTMLAQADRASQASSSSSSARRPSPIDTRLGPLSLPGSALASQRPSDAISPDSASHQSIQSGGSGHSRIQKVEPVRVQSLRVFLVNQQRYVQCEVPLHARARDVVNDALDREALQKAAGRGAWAIFDVSPQFGTERPLREYEIVSSVLEARPDPGEGFLLLRQTELAPCLSIRAVPNVSPSLAGYVYVRDRKLKWTKRWLELRNHSLYHAKSDKGKDEVSLCHLSSFDVYMADAAKTKAPKSFAFALRSQMSTSQLENAADYIHYFSLSDAAAHRDWIRAIMNARAYVLRRENVSLFQMPPEAVTGAAMTNGGLTSPTSPPSAPPFGVHPSSGTTASSPLLSMTANGSPVLRHPGSIPPAAGPGSHRRPLAAPQVTSPTMEGSTGPFQSGSLLAKEAMRSGSGAGIAPSSLALSNQERSKRMMEEERRLDVLERQRRAREDGKPLMQLYGPKHA